MTRWQHDNMTTWQDNTMTRWQGAKITRWKDDEVTRRQDDNITILQITGWQDDKMTKWKDKTTTRLEDDKMTNSQNDKLTRWQEEEMTWNLYFFYFKPSLNSKLCLADSLIHSLTHKAPNLYLFYSTQCSHLWALDHGSWIMWKQLRQICQEPFDSCR